MKSAVFALIAALLVAGLVLTPAAAAPVTSTCGDTYVVQRGEYLNLIARKCGVTLSDLIKVNPQITNINRIYPGQVINITSSGTVSPTPTTPSTTTSTYTVRWGDTLAIIAWRFGTSVSQLLAFNPSIVNPSLIYAGQVLKIPTGTSTTPGTVPVTGTRVSISSASVKPGGTVTVSVWSFPANAEIDFRMGKQGAAASVYVDAVTDAYGRASATLTIPSSAVAGEKWVVLVLTTSMPAGKNLESTSPVITIY
jgi:LysM repeat protein